MTRLCHLNTVLKLEWGTGAKYPLPESFLNFFIKITHCHDQGEPWPRWPHLGYATVPKPHLIMNALRYQNEKWFSKSTPCVFTCACSNLNRLSAIHSCGNVVIGSKSRQSISAKKAITTRPLQSSVRTGEFTYLCECVQASNRVFLCIALVVFVVVLWYYSIV